MLDWVARKDTALPNRASIGVWDRFEPSKHLNMRMLKAVDMIGERFSCLSMQSQQKRVQIESCGAILGYFEVP
jgi:hypothetical protein